MIEFLPFLKNLHAAGLTAWAQELPALIKQQMHPSRHGDLRRWSHALQQLPDWPVAEVLLDRSAIQICGENPLSDADKNQLTAALMGLHPWRKGPFDLFGVKIDTEWRSDWKWDRLKDQIKPLAGRKVLDVGCGSGYHLWRMRGAGAELAVGIDPTLLFNMQFAALQKYIGDHKVGLLPLGIEHLPPKLNFFDTVFSMGVLYHRKSPFDHLFELRDALRPGGELVLETLVIEGNGGEVLVPDDRYARMNNVWFIPTCSTLQQWLKKAGFKQVQRINITTTSTDEQRATPWMTFESLSNCLDSQDNSRTIEGYPAPRRAIFVAEAPQ